MRLTWLVSLAVVVAGAAGCGQEDDEGDVRSVIANFYSALEAGDAQAACDQLSADTRTGRVAYNAEQFGHQQAALSWFQYIGTSDFWNRTLQNWQSEFLAVGSMAVLSIYLRQRGSPESKPVGAPHSATGAEG